MLGLPDGLEVGTSEGLMMGVTKGPLVGLLLELVERLKLGNAFGDSDGSTVGIFVDGLVVGDSDGNVLEIVVEGSLLGNIESSILTDGSSLGIALGSSEQCLWQTS